MTPARPVLLPVKMFFAAIVVAFIAATAVTGAAAASSSADGHCSDVVQAKKEWKTTDVATLAPLKKEW